MSASNLVSVPRGEAGVERLTPSPESVFPERFRLVRTPPPLTRVAPPDALVEAIADGLREIGCSYAAHRIVRRIGGEELDVEIGLVSDGGEVRRALLYFGDSVLVQFEIAHKRLLDELRETIQSDVAVPAFEVLYVFHDSHPDGAYKNLMSSEWPDRYGIGTRFIPVADLSGGFSDWELEEKVRYLRRELDLDGDSGAARTPGDRPAAQRVPITKVSYPEVSRLTLVVASLPQFVDPRGRVVLLRGVGLSDLALRIDLSGAPLTVSRDLVLELLESGATSGLRSLLEYVETLSDLPNDDREVVTTLLASYTFD